MTTALVGGIVSTEIRNSIIFVTFQVFYLGTGIIQRPIDVDEAEVEITPTDTNITLGGKIRDVVQARAVQLSYVLDPAGVFIPSWSRVP